MGYDVDTYLLDSLTQGHHGRSTYVQPGQNLDEVVSGFYESISTPVLTNLTLDFGSLAAYDVYPNPLPDLFAGSQVVVVGRYRQGGTVDVTLKGDVNGQSQILSFPGQVFSTDSSGASDALASLPRLWATRKVGYLLNKIRLDGVDKESVDQIVKLSIRYGIVTPYTSYLVTEPSPLGLENQNRVAQQVYNNYLAAPTQSTGKAAVDQAAGAGGMSQAQQAPAVPSTDSSGSTSNQTIRVVGSRTFVYDQGIWTDTAYDPQSMQPIQVSFLSTDYFKLVASRSELASAFALGENVIVVVDGKAYKVVPDNTTVPPVVIPPTQPAPTTVVVLPGQNTPTPGPSVTVIPSITPGVVSTDAGPWSPLMIAGGLVVVFAAAYLMLRRK